MNTLTVTLLAGSIIFIGVYLSFSYWQERIWSRLEKDRDETYALYRDLFFMQMTVDRVAKQQLYAAIGLAAVFFYLFWPFVTVAIPVALLMFFAGWKAPGFILKYLIRPGRVKKFSVQMVDALTLMANGLKSGLNISQTLQIVVDEMPKPITEEFDFVLKETRLGVPLEKAFQNLAVRVPSDDVRIFVTSVNILSETGGNVAETFQNITKTIRERLKLQSKITAMTAQGMTSAFIVGALPWVLGAVLYMIDPGAMKPLFTTLPGFAVLLVILTLEAIGFFVILKIVKIKV